MKPRLFTLVPPALSVVCYTAGVIDGEGSIQINPSKGGSGKRYWTLTVQVSGNGMEFLKGLREEWGGIGSLTYWKARGRKLDRVSCNWRIYSAQAEWFLGVVRPHLRLKRQQADVAIEFRGYVAGGRGTLTAEMSEKRIELAARMRELNDRNGKGSADASNAVGVK